MSVTEKPMIEPMVAVCFNEENPDVRTAIVSLPHTPCGLPPVEYYAATQERNRKAGERIAALFGFSSHTITGQLIVCGEEGKSYVAIIPVEGLPPSYLSTVEKNMIPQRAGYTSGMPLSELDPSQRMIALRAYDKESPAVI